MSKDLGKYKVITLARASKRNYQHEAPRTTLLSRKNHYKLNLGIGHDAILHLYDSGKNQGEIKLMLKGNDKNDEASELIGITACEDNIQKFSAKC